MKYIRCSVLWIVILKKPHVFCVLTNQTKQKLLPIIKDNIYSNHEGDHMDLVEENDSIEIEKLSY